MGMHIGFVAAKTSLDNLRRAFEAAWPEFDIVEEQRGFADEAALDAWQQSRTHHVTDEAWSSEEPGSDVYLLCAHGEWAFLLDHAYVLASDSGALESLSQTCGEVFGFVVETAGDTAFFNCARDGKIVRSLADVEGEVEAAGDPLPAEAAVPNAHFRKDEAERLMAALGIPAIYEVYAAATTLAVKTVDRTDYRDLRPRHAPHAATAIAAAIGAVKPTTKPWWKWW